MTNAANQMTKPRIISMKKNYPISKLSEWDHNPRFNDEAVKAVGRSVEHFGGLSPIIADKDGRICAGHTRYKAALEIGLKTFPVILVDFGSDESFKAYNVADNQTATIADWDELALSDLVIELDEIDFDTKLLGFDDDRLMEILNGPDIDLEDAGADAISVGPSITQPSDLWRLGNHWLLCGDATNEADVTELMAGNEADMVFTDPPYGVNHEGVPNDDQDGLVPLLQRAFKNCDNVMRRGACYYICHPDIHAYEFIGAVRNQGWKQARPPVVLWIKNALVLGRGDYHSRSEPILYGWKSGRGHNQLQDRTQDNVWEYDRPRVSNGHPTMKPVALIGRAVRNSSNVGDNIIDLFLGSGSTLIACESTNRRCFAMEIDPHYCDVAVKRWEDTTGQKAERYPAGEPRERNS